MSDSSYISLLDKQEAFESIFSLSQGRTDNFPYRTHDSIHAMTGCGIGIGDEMRVGIVEEVLIHGPKKASLASAHKRMMHLHTIFNKFYLEPKSLNIEATPLQNDDYAKHDALTVPLTREEVAEIFEVAQAIHKKLVQLAGRGLPALWTQHYQEIPFAEVDFSAPIHDIKMRNMLPENWVVEQANLKILFDAASAKGLGHNIPAPGTPWHGPLRKPFAA